MVTSSGSRLPRNSLSLGPTHSDIPANYSIQSHMSGLFPTTTLLAAIHLKAFFYSRTQILLASLTPYSIPSHCTGTPDNCARLAISSYSFRDAFPDALTVVRVLYSASDALTLPSTPCNVECASAADYCWHQKLQSEGEVDLPQNRPAGPYCGSRRERISSERLRFPADCY